LGHLGLQPIWDDFAPMQLVVSTKQLHNLMVIDDPEACLNLRVQQPV